ncbi:MAG: MFS transporter [Ilumatobacteraceae bacterium]
MLERILDDSYPPEVRRAVVPLTVARLATNAVYRFAPPFLATISRGLDVDLAALGVALAITEVSGLASPLIGRVVDRVPRRPAMVFGLVGVGAGAAVAAGSPGIVMFTVGLLLLAVTKVVFDVGLISWTADHIPYERRGRVVGMIETSWALGLLLGATALGLVAAATSWRWSYVIGGLLTAATAGLVLAFVDREDGRHRAGVGGRRRDVGHLPPSAWAAMIGLLGLMGAAQALFVTFGAWLEDEFGIGTAGLAAVTFGIGALELAASLTSAARTDRWGKELSVVRGAAVMLPAGLLLAAVDGHLLPGLLALGVFIGAFEFSIVSAMPIGTLLVPGAPGRGTGVMLGCGTIGRAVTAIPATRLYDRFGMSSSALLAAAFACLAGGAMLWRHHLLAPRPELRRAG